MRLRGFDDEAVMLEMDQLCCHLASGVDFELAGKKVFWVSPELSEQLAETTLDIGGDMLELPFPSCVFVFRDGVALRLAQELMQHSFEREPPQVVTVYVRSIPPEYGQEGVRFTFYFDGFDDEWPYMLQREIPTGGTAHLDEILASHPEESDDPIFRTEEMQSLVRLTINALLYTTSDAFESERRAPAPPRERRLLGTLSGEEVFYLPGRVAIGPRSEAVSDSASTGASGRTIKKRFWVRGHWRRPNADWKDQRLRWVRPHLKGPDMAAIVQRDYELKG